MKSQKTQFIFKREKRRSIIWLMLGFFSLFAGLGSVPSHAERIKDLASIQGVRSNPLVGYGLVVGLDGSGDQVRQTPFTQQSLTNMLAQLGVSVPQGTNMQLRNVAAVMVTAQLPAFARPGQTLDVVVSSMGNAKSLRGGTLLMTPLKGADGQVYAMAQGNLLIGGAGAQAGGSSVQINQLNGGIISGGATVEQSVPTTFAQDGRIYLEMHSTDFGVAQQAAAALNRALGEKLGKGGGKQVIATALDGRVVELHAPLDPNALAAFLSKVEQVNVKLPPAAARVIINARTGTVVMNRSVTLEEAAVAAGNLTVVINRQQQVSQPDTPLAGGQTVVTDSAQIDIRSPDGSSHTLKRLRTGANLMDVIRALNTLGASAQDLVTILQTLKSAGALRAELEII